MGNRVYDIGRMEARKSIKETRQYRQVPKNHEDSFTRRVSNRYLDRPDLKIRLLGTFLKTDVFDDYGRVNAMIIDVYPHCVRAQYFFKKKNKENKNKDIISGPMYLCYSTSDLVEQGIISFATGRAEVL